MRTILILGGYGTFGRRIALRAAASGFQILVAGRSEAKAKAFCTAHPALSPLRLDRVGGLAAALAEHRPFAVVDAAGPFQGCAYDVVEAAIDAGAHYLDIADGRDFVVGITTLDAAAKAAGVVALSGASSLPALSGAVARRLADGLDEVKAVEIVLSASSRGTAGASVAAAILSYVGKPIRLWRGRRWIRGFGWQPLQRRSFAVAGARPLQRRLVALADVADLDLLPACLPGRPAVTFLAGTDVALHVVGLWLLGWLVRWRWLRDGRMLAPVLLRLHRWSRWSAGLRSAFEIRLFGTSGARRIERRWTLIAERGDGPEIPSLAASILLDRLAALPPGARDAGQVLSLSDFEGMLGGLAAAWEQRERLLPAPLYARLLGSRFAGLAPAVRSLHEVLADGGAAGRATVRRGRNPVTRFVASLFGFPPEGEHSLHLHIVERNGEETWIRDFGGRRFASRLSDRGGLLIERFGLFRFGFDLPVENGALTMAMRRWWLGPLPLPLAFAPSAPAREWEEGGRFRFEVAIALPVLGLLVDYRGWLAPAKGRSPVPSSRVTAEPAPGG